MAKANDNGVMPDGGAVKERKAPSSARDFKLVYFADDNLFLAACGLAFVFAAMQGMRITTPIGIYPVETSLIARHCLGVVVLVVALLVLRHKKRDWPLAARRAGYVIVGGLLSAAIAMRYSGLFFGLESSPVELVGKVAEEALELILITMWASLILRNGLTRTAYTIAYAILMEAVILMILSFFQKIPCAIGLSVLPLVSMGFFVAYTRRSPGTLLEGESPSTFPAHMLAKSMRRPTVVTFAVLFCISFMLGGIIFESLETQSAMREMSFVQQCIFAGYGIGAVLILLTNHRIGERMYLPILFVVAFACCAISLYLTTFLMDEAVGGYLIVQSIARQVLIMMIWIMPFFVASDAARRMEKLVWFYIAYVGAKILSTICMVMKYSSGYYAFNVLLVVALVALMFFCIFLFIHLGELSQDAPTMAMAGASAAGGGSIGAEGVRADVDDRGEGARTEVADVQDARVEVDRLVVVRAGAQVDDGIGEEKRAFFKEAVESLADEYDLTRQERKVLLLLAKGLNATSISEEMVVSVNTTKSHMRNTYAKLGVHSQQEIIFMVRERKALLLERSAAAC